MELAAQRNNLPVTAYPFSFHILTPQLLADTFNVGDIFEGLYKPQGSETNIIPDDLLAVEAQVEFPSSYLLTHVLETPRFGRLHRQSWRWCCGGRNVRNPSLLLEWLSDTMRCVGMSSWDFLRWGTPLNLLVSLYPFPSLSGVLMTL